MLIYSIYAHCSYSKVKKDLNLEGAFQVCILVGKTSKRLGQWLHSAKGNYQLNIDIDIGILSSQWMWTMPTFCKGGLSVEYWYWYWYSEWSMWTMPTLWKGGTVSWKTVVVKRSKRDCTFPFPAPAPLKLFVRQLFWCSWDLWTEQCYLNFLSLF